MLAIKTHLTSEVLTGANQKDTGKPKEHSNCGGRGGVLIITTGQKNPTQGTPTSLHGQGSLEGFPCRTAGTREMGGGWKQPEAQSPLLNWSSLKGHCHAVLFIC